jgi:mRNA interferase RelE/StbE
VPKYSVFLHRKALKSLQTLQPEEIKAKIKETIESLTEYPLSLRQLDVQKLEGFERAFRIRVGSYRIIFHVDKQEGTVFVTQIEKRESVYE